MDKLFDQIIRELPSQTIPYFLLICASFIFVFYSYSHRSFSDTINHKYFLTSVVIIVAAFLLKNINDKDVKLDANVEVANGNAPIIIIPDFNLDESDQYKSLVAQYIRASIGALGGDITRVMTLDSSIPDYQSAKYYSEKYSTSSVLFEAKVIIIGETVYICFQLLDGKSGLTKAYPPMPLNKHRDTIEDLSITILKNPENSANAESNPLLNKISHMESEISSLKNRETIRYIDTATEVNSYKAYHNKFAIVIGSDSVENNSIPSLRYSIKDAKSVADNFEESGFIVHSLFNPTSEDMLSAVDKIIADVEPQDLIVLYYVGSSVLDSSETMRFATYDFDIESKDNAVSINQIVEKLKKSSSNVLLVLDACHGTSGLDRSGSTPSAGNAIHIISGSQDDGFGYESSAMGGSIFTQAMLHTLRQDGDGSLSTSELMESVNKKVREMSRGMQNPKIETLGDARRIYLK